MVLLEAAARLLASKVEANKRIPHQRNASAHKVRESVLVYDYDVAGGTGLVWQATLPLDILQDHLPDTCRYNDDIGRIRLIGCLIGALGGVVLGIGAWYVLFVLVLHAPLMAVLQDVLLLGGIVGLAPGGLLGWLMGLHLRTTKLSSPISPKGLWMVRRLTFTAGNPLSDTQVGQDEPENLARFEYQRGVIPASWRVVRALPYTGLEDQPVDYELEEEQVLAEATAHSLHLYRSNGKEGATKGPVYRPIVNRANVLYEDLKQRIVRKRRKQVAMSGWHKLQIGGTIALALAIVGLMIFAGLVLERKPKEGADSLNNKLSLVERHYGGGR